MRRMVLLVVVQDDHPWPNVSRLPTQVKATAGSHETLNKLPRRNLIGILVHHHGMHDANTLRDGQVETHCAPMRSAIWPLDHSLASDW